MTKARNIHTAEIDGGTVNVHGGDMPLSEMRQYVKHYTEKYKDKRVKSLDITLVSGGFADVDINFMPMSFERIRRITGKVDMVVALINAVYMLIENEVLGDDFVFQCVEV